MLDINNINVLYLSIFGYITLGVCWSFWRWNIHCKKIVSIRIQDSRSARFKHHLPTFAKEELSITGNVDRIVSWIISWPISVFTSTIGDIVHVLKTFVTKWCSNVYQKISNRHLKRLDIVLDELEKEEEEASRNAAKEKRERWENRSTKAQDYFNNKYPDKESELDKLNMPRGGDLI